MWTNKALTTIIEALQEANKVFSELDTESPYLTESEN